MASEAARIVRRNRPQTEAKLRAALARLLAKSGFGALTPSAVAKEAGVDKMLIYRYFGDLRRGMQECGANQARCERNWCLHSRRHGLFSISLYLETYIKSCLCPETR